MGEEGLGCVRVAAHAARLGDEEERRGPERLRDGLCHGVGVHVVHLPRRVDAERRDDGHVAAPEERGEHVRRHVLDVADPPEVHLLAVDVPRRAADDLHEAAVRPGDADGGDVEPCGLRDELRVELAPERPLYDVKVEVGGHAPPVDDARFVAEPPRHGRGLRPAAVHEDDGRRLAEPGDVAPERFEERGVGQERAAELDDDGAGFVRVRHGRFMLHRKASRRPASAARTAGGPRRIRGSPSGRGAGIRPEGGGSRAARRSRRRPRPRPGGRGGSA